VVQEDVRGLDVTVENSRGMGGGERRADRDHDLAAARGREPCPVVELPIEGLPLQQLHHQVGDAALRHAEVQHGDRVRVLTVNGTTRIAR